MFCFFKSILALLSRNYLFPDRSLVAMVMAQRSHCGRDNDLPLDHINGHYSDTDSDICTVAELPKLNKCVDVSSDASSPNSKTYPHSSMATPTRATSFSSRSLSL